jgi:hypothetical protein
MSIETSFVCSECGAERGCACDAPAIKPIKRAEAAIAADPGKSDRAIAKKIGVSDKTVAKARRSTADNSAVEKRTGLDGKTRKLPKQTKKTKKNNAHVAADDAGHKAVYARVKALGPEWHLQMPSAKLKKYVLHEAPGYSGCGSWGWELPKLDDVISKLDEIEKKQAIASERPEAAAEDDDYEVANPNDPPEHAARTAEENAQIIADSFFRHVFGHAKLWGVPKDLILQVLSKRIEAEKEALNSLRPDRTVESRKSPTGAGVPVQATVDQSGIQATASHDALPVVEDLPLVTETEARAGNDASAEAMKARLNRFDFPLDGSIPDFLMRERPSATLPTGTADREEPLAKNPDAKPFWRAA